MSLSEINRAIGSRMVKTERQTGVGVGEAAVLWLEHIVLITMQTNVVNSEKALGIGFKKPKVY